MKIIISVLLVSLLCACSSFGRHPPAYTEMFFESELNPIINIPPDYPSDALYLGLEGDVGISFVIGSNNRATQIKVIDGLDNPLDKAARKALEEAFFHPRDIGRAGIAIARFSLNEPFAQKSLAQH